MESADYSIYNGKQIKVESISTVNDLHRYLNKTMSKQWFDNDPNSFEYVIQAQSCSDLEFKYSSDFDENGIIFWIGTNAHTVPEWTNPALLGMINITSSQGNNLAFGKMHEVVRRNKIPVNCHTNDDSKSWLQIDFGMWIDPTAYTLRHARGYSKSALRNWCLQASKDGIKWFDLIVHNDDCSLNEPGSTHTWSIPEHKELEKHTEKGWRMFRLQQLGKNSSNKMSYISVCGFEIYGKINGACSDINDVFKARKEMKKIASKQMVEGARVVRNKEDWKWKNQDSGENCCGTVIKPITDGWVEVKWDVSGVSNNYRMGEEGRFDVKLATDADEKYTIGKKNCRDDKRSSRSSGSSFRSNKLEQLLSKRAGVDTLRSFLSKSAFPSSKQQMRDLDRRNSRNRRESESSAGKSVMSVMRAMQNKNTKSFQGSGDATNLKSKTSTKKHTKFNEKKKSLSSNLTTSQKKKKVQHLWGEFSSQDSSPRQSNKNFSFLSFGSEPSPSAEALKSKTLTPEALNASDLQSSKDRSSSVDHPSTNTNLQGKSVSLDSVQQQSCSDMKVKDRATGVSCQQAQPDANIQSQAVSSSVNMSTTSDPVSASASVPNLSSPQEFSSVMDEFLTSNVSRAPALLDVNSVVEDISSKNELPKNAPDTVVSNALTTAQSVPNLSTSSTTTSQCTMSSNVANLTSLNLPPLTASFSSTSSPHNPHLVASNEQEAEMLRFLVSDLQSLDLGQNVVSQMLGDYEDDTINEDEHDLRDFLGDEEEFDEDLEDDDFDEEEDLRLMEHELVMKMTSFLSGEPQHHPMSFKMNNQSKDDSNNVVVRKLDDLLPAFDPRPGRLNLPQTVDFNIPSPGSKELETRMSLAKLQILKHKNVKKNFKIFISMSSSNEKVELNDCGSSTLFKCIQDLYLKSSGVYKTDKLSKLWDPTYTLHFEENTSFQTKVQSSNSLNDENTNIIVKNFPEKDNEVTNINNILFLLKFLYEITEDKNKIKEEFICKKINAKLDQQIEDFISMTCQSIPEWCQRVVTHCPFLFPFETRNKFINSTAFGVTRSIVWMQTNLDNFFANVPGGLAALAGLPGNRNMTSSLLAAAVASSSDDLIQLGRLRHERVKIPRNEDEFFTWALNTINIHASRKSILEVEFLNEEGTGLGPTLEFYALVAAKLQQKQIKMWIFDDKENTQNEGSAYIQQSCGLFPAPLPLIDDDKYNKIIEYFEFFGSLIAKCLQDERLIDLPMSNAFVKILCNGIHLYKSDGTSLLNMNDLKILDPVRYNLFSEIEMLINAKNEISHNKTLSKEEKLGLINQLKLEQSKCKIEDLCLSMEFIPCSNVFDFESYPLCEESDCDVTIKNAEDYVNLTLDFMLRTGIERQVLAMKRGFSKILSPSFLTAYQPDELVSVLCGEQSPQWTREDIINHTEVKLGFTKQSSGFLKLVNVLCDLNAEQRKKFLQFTTGCSSLPPGGLCNLNPPLTVVRKVEAGDGSFPSVNTCVHYLKLPDYSSEEILKSRLLDATLEQGFHLN